MVHDAHGLDLISPENSRISTSIPILPRSCETVHRNIHHSAAGLWYEIFCQFMADAGRGHRMRYDGGCGNRWCIWPYSGTFWISSCVKEGSLKRSQSLPLHLYGHGTLQTHPAWASPLSTGSISFLRLLSATEQTRETLPFFFHKISALSAIFNWLLFCFLPDTSFRFFKNAPGAVWWKTWEQNLVKVKYLMNR